MPRSHRFGPRDGPLGGAGRARAFGGGRRADSSAAALAARLEPALVSLDFAHESVILRCYTLINFEHGQEYRSLTILLSATLLARTLAVRSGPPPGMLCVLGAGSPGPQA